MIFIFLILFIIILVCITYVGVRYSVTRKGLIMHMPHRYFDS